MKSQFSRILSGFVCISLLGLLIPQAQVAYAAMDNWQKGATIHPAWNGEFGSDSFKQSVTNLVNTHANYLTLVIPLYQSNLSSTDIQAGGNTPTDTSLISGITYAHSLGLKVMLKPHLESYTGDWRAYINPPDRAGWFANYGNMIIKYAKIAQQYGVEDFCVGAELISMSSSSVNPTNTQNWKNLISSVRAVYSGKLTYSGSWGPSGFVDEKNNIQFWDSLDYIGISAYFNLYGDGSVQNLKNQWNNYNQSDIQPLSQRWGGKPVVFTEIGYRSLVNAHTQPWEYKSVGNSDQTEQANDYQALFEYWSNYSFMRGVELWDWSSNPNAGGGGTDFTPQNKLAQGVMTTWFGNTPPPPPVPLNFGVTASAQPNPIVVNQSIDIATVVTNNSSATGNIIVDVEVYNSANQKIFQKYYDNQNFTQGQAQTYHSNWTPSAAGDYKVKVGIFNYNWSQIYFWADNALLLSTNGITPTPTPTPTITPTPTPTPANTAINIWWPTNGVTVPVTTPLKGMVTNLAISQYTMYWQVDGGGLVPMPDNNTGYPHKEFIVDLSGWNWHGNGPYHINFVAKDLNGALIGQKATDIYIAR